MFRMNLERIQNGEDRKPWVVGPGQPLSLELPLQRVAIRIRQAEDTPRRGTWVAAARSQCRWEEATAKAGNKQSPRWRREREVVVADNKMGNTSICSCLEYHKGLRYILLLF